MLPRQPDPHAALQHDGQVRVDRRRAGIGSIEALSLIGDKFAPQGPLWRAVARLSENLCLVGYLLVAFFVCWLASYLLYRLGGYNRIEVPAQPSSRSL